MKHTMKKLLCMALAIMLLVSAVPVFAMAEGDSLDLSQMQLDGPASVDDQGGESRSLDIQPAQGDGISALSDDDDVMILAGGTPTAVNVLVTITIDGVTYKNNQELLNDTMTVKNALKQFFPSGWEQKYWDTDYLKGTEPCNDGTLVEGASVISAKLTTKTTTINVKMNGTSGVAVTRKITDKLTLNKDLLREATLVVPDGKEIKGWNIEDGASGVADGSTVDITYPMTVNALVGDKGGSGTSDDTVDTTTKYTVRFYNVNNAQFRQESVASGSKVKATVNDLESNVGSKANYNFAGWRANGVGDILTTGIVVNMSINANTNFYPVFVDANGNSSGSGSGSGGSSSSDKNRFPYDVVLHIYMNNKVDEPVKNIVINDSLASDGVVSLSEVKNEVFKYFSAKTSAGISFAGLYYARGNWVKDYATYNGEYDSISGINAMRQVSQVDINVMITNAKAKSSSTADSSNPKTGDTIFVPVMVMGVTATALAAAYVFGKKRIAR